MTRSPQQQRNDSECLQPPARGYVVSPHDEENERHHKEQQQGGRELDGVHEDADRAVQEQEDDHVAAIGGIGGNPESVVDDMVSWSDRAVVCDGIMLEWKCKVD